MHANADNGWWSLPEELPEYSLPGIWLIYYSLYFWPCIPVFLAFPTYFSIPFSLCFPEASQAWGNQIFCSGFPEICPAFVQREASSLLYWTVNRPALCSGRRQYLSLPRLLTIQMKGQPGTKASWNKLLLHARNTRDPWRIVPHQHSHWKDQWGIKKSKVAHRVKVIYLFPLRNRVIITTRVVFSIYWVLTQQMSVYLVLFSIQWVCLVLCSVFYRYISFRPVKYMIIPHFTTEKTKA